MHKKIVFIIFLSRAIYPVTNYLISDKDFTNTNMYSKYQYISVFSNRIAIDDINDIYYYAIKYKINPFVMLCQRIKEGRPRNDYAFGCLYHVDKANGNTSNKSWNSQVELSAYKMRSYFNKNSCIVYVCDDKSVILCENMATAALYIYTPFYRVYQDNDYRGNFVFMNVWNRYKKKLEVLNDTKIHD